MTSEHELGRIGVISLLKRCTSVLLIRAHILHTLDNVTFKKKKKKKTHNTATASCQDNDDHDGAGLIAELLATSRFQPPVI